ncbi:hypothetical protein pb186bvf_012911 [Paramecium bursaria]
MIILLLSLIQIQAKPLNPKKVLFAINCGAPSAHKGQSGIQYEKDVQSDPDTVVADYNQNTEVSSQTIKFTREPDIYLTERHAYKSFSYQVPLQKEGTYVLILKFAEMYFSQPNKRVFNVKFGQKRVITNLDVFARSGRYAANDEYLEFEYTGGQVYFNNTLCVEAVSNGKLSVQLEKTSLDNPYIHGLVLFGGQLNDTDYNDYQELRANWDKIQKQEQYRQEQERNKKQESRVKRKERVKIRNDQINEQEYSFETQNQNVQQVPRQTLKSLITGPIGTAGLWVGFLVTVFIFKNLFNRISNPKQVTQSNEETKKKK